jgi:hypothetical protein
VRVKLRRCLPPPPFPSRVPFSCWARPQLLLTIDNLVTGCTLDSVPEDKRQRLVDVARDVFVRPESSKEPTLATTLMAGVLAMGQDIAARGAARAHHARDTVKHVRATADRQMVWDGRRGGREELCVLARARVCVCVCGARGGWSGGQGARCSPVMLRVSQQVVRVVCGVARRFCTLTSSLPELPHLCHCVRLCCPWIPQAAEILLRFFSSFQVCVCGRAVCVRGRVSLGCHRPFPSGGVRTLGLASAAPTGVTRVPVTVGCGAPHTLVHPSRLTLKRWMRWCR